jgi:hypothetical protein
MRIARTIHAARALSGRFVHAVVRLKLLTSVGVVIRKRRMALGFSQETFTDLIGMTPVRHIIWGAAPASVKPSLDWCIAASCIELVRYRSCKASPFDRAHQSARLLRPLHYEWHNSDRRD